LFSSQEIVNNRVIGLDGTNRKVLILTQIDTASFDHYVVNLDEVKDCTVKKHYGNIRYGGSKETYLESVSLHFNFHNKKEPIDMPFYEHIENNIYHAEDFEQRAGHWKEVLTKMLNGSLKKVV
jgi:hypothetical protein